MQNLQSIRMRLLISVASNALRSMIGFLSSLLIARSLTPVGYGDLMFLLGSFIAIRSLLDMGSSSAFFTFISQRDRDPYFYWMYFLWLAVQFIITIFILWMVIPSGLFYEIWLGHNREIVLLAFFASFMQQQVWQAVNQIGEAMRKTFEMQCLNLIVSIFYLSCIYYLSLNDRISIELILIILAGQYILAACIFYSQVNIECRKKPLTNSSTRKILAAYWRYCKPLILLSLVSFSYEFADKWMLQKYGGGVEQGYFQIASQFGAVSLLATTSILNVFWKEIASAWENKDRDRVAKLYLKISRVLVTIGAIICGLLLPWSDQIVKSALGPQYINAWPVLAIMLIYPIHQSMGQIGGTMFLASGQTRYYMLISFAVMLVSVPISFVLLAPASNGWISGFELGALGMACKMVVLGVISVNIQAWVIARHNGWKMDWKHQAVSIPLMISLGFISKYFAETVWTKVIVAMPLLVFVIALTVIFYMCFVTVTLWFLPGLIGTNRGILSKFFGKYLPLPVYFR